MKTNNNDLLSQSKFVTKSFAAEFNLEIVGSFIVHYKKRQMG